MKQTDKKEAKEVQCIENKAVAYDVLYLVTCELKMRCPDKEKVAGMNLEAVYAVSKYQSLTAMVAYALERVEELPKGTEQVMAAFREAKAKAIRKNIMLGAEQQKLCEFMESQGIRNMPLKGVILKDLYPKMGMRQMADNDILYEEQYQQKLVEYMTQNGYTVKSVGKGNHDVFMKTPVYHFELHTSLFGIGHEQTFVDYYSNVWERLVPAEGKKYSYGFTAEDFYIYMIAHEYKHYTGGGTGLRSLVDSAVYLKAKPELDLEYIQRESKKLGIGEFEEKTRKLSLKLFGESGEKLSEEETAMLERFLLSGTYGTMQQVADNRVKKYFETSGKKSKLSYMLSRIFPEMSFYKAYYPFFYRHKILLPFLWVFRVCRVVVARRYKIKTELESLKKY